jgi:hypothetical protein
MKKSIDYLKCLGPQYWSENSNIDITPFDLEVFIKGPTFRVLVTKVQVQVEPPDEPGTKTGQEKTVKVNIDGGSISVKFKWRGRGSWEAIEMNVNWSIHNARTSTIITEVIQLANAIITERARIPQKPFLGEFSTEEAFGHVVACIDEEIRNAEYHLNQLRDSRIRMHSERAENIQAISEYDSALATVAGRIDALIGEFTNRNGTF